MERILEPEILDHLPADHPAAIRSRRDLRLANWAMGNHRWIARRLRRLLQPGWRVLEIGSGDGTLLHHLLDRGVCGAEQLIGIDLAPRPDDLAAGITWVQQDIFADKQLPEAEIVVATLVLHHFTPEQLALLGRRAGQGRRAMLVCETARKTSFLAQGFVFSTLVDFDYISCHDMLISIRAGFRDDELPEFLGLHDWRCRTRTTLLGSYRMEAIASSS